MTRDHLIPRARGGARIVEDGTNTVPSCRPCNGAKGDVLIVGIRVADGAVVVDWPVARRHVLMLRAEAEKKRDRRASRKLVLEVRRLRKARVRLSRLY